MKACVADSGERLAIAGDLIEALRLGAGQVEPVTVGEVTAREPGGWRGLSTMTLERLAERSIVSTLDGAETAKAVEAWARREHFRLERVWWAIAPARVRA